MKHVLCVVALLAGGVMIYVGNGGELPPIFRPEPLVDGPVYLEDTAAVALRKVDRQWDLERAGTLREAIGKLDGWEASGELAKWLDAEFDADRAKAYRPLDPWMNEFMGTKDGGETDQFDKAVIRKRLSEMADSLEGN